MAPTLSEIYRPIRSQLQAADNQLLKELTPQRNIPHSLMVELTRHVARMTGKRLRPALALLGAAVARKTKRGQTPLGPKGSDPIGSQAISLAAAVEMFHTATLLHDDVIDGATLRRGLTTLNAKWGDTLSVLSGDYLYAQAFCLLSRLGNPAVLNLMSDTARLVCEGEVAQIQHQYDLALSRAAYIKIIKWKTASLMGAAAEAGALLGGATGSQARRLGVFGTQFGLAFQILDDTQDLLGDQEAMGKSLGTDLALGQMTLPLLYLRDRTGPRLRARLAHWFNGNGSRTAAQALEQVKILKEEALRHEVPAYCQRAANQFLSKARAALSIFPASPAKESLLALTQFVLQ